MLTRDIRDATIGPVHGDGRHRKGVYYGIEESPCGFRSELGARIFRVGLVRMRGGPSDEQVIRDQLTSELDTIKNISDESVAAFTEGAGEDAFMEFGISNEQFVTEYFKGFDYSIDSVTVNGDTAEAQITMTSRTMTDFTAVFSAKADELASGDEILTIESEEELNQRLGELIMQIIQDTELKQCGPVTITFTKVDGEWTPDGSASDILSQVLL